LEVKTGIAHLPLAPATPVKTGQIVTLLSYSAIGATSVLKTVAEGTVSAEASESPGKLIALSAVLKPANAGGPLLSAQGEVLGMLWPQTNVAEKITYATPAAAVAEALDKIKSLSLEEKDKATSMHNVRAAFIRTVKAGRICSRGDDYISEWWKLNKSSPKFIIADLQQDARKKYVRFLDERKLTPLLDMKDINKTIASIGTDPRVPEAMRQQMTKLWATYKALSSDFDQPGGTYDEYVARCQRNGMTLTELTNQLRPLLGVEEEEIAVKVK
jgi:hypothetical protein